MSPTTHTITVAFTVHDSEHLPRNVDDEYIVSFVQKMLDDRMMEIYEQHRSWFLIEPDVW